MSDRPAPHLETFGDLLALVEAESRGDWPSRVNQGMTHTQALDVLAAGLRTHPADMRIVDACRGDLYRRQVLRECRSRQ